jgi:glycosyltransferase involved in cell wall biosynthesis
MPDMRPVLPRLPLDNVERTGTVPKSDLPTYLSASHVLVLPSIEEGFGLVQGEAMACGCPVISTSSTGAANLFSDGVEGFIVPPRDPAAIADRLQRLADDRNLQQEMRTRSLERVRSLGGWNEYGDRWVSVLQKLCARA